jgi:hypothetical protein
LTFALVGNSYADTLEVRCDFDGVAVNVYDVPVSIGGGYYTGGEADPGSGSIRAWASPRVATISTGRARRRRPTAATRL